MDVIGMLQNKQLLRVDEAAKILNVSRWTVYRWVEAGRLGGARAHRQFENFQPHAGAALHNLHLRRSDPGRTRRCTDQAQFTQAPGGERTVSRS